MAHRVVGLEWIVERVAVHVHTFEVLASVHQVNLLGPTPEAQDEVQCGFFLDVVVRERAPVLQLFARENNPLLVDWHTLYIGYLLFYRLNCVCGFNVQRNGFPVSVLTKICIAFTLVVKSLIIWWR
jgi:hypothetical protein